MKDFLTVEEAAKFLRMSPAAVRRHAKDFGAFKMPGCRRWLFARSILITKTQGAA
jgi:hypothetical protein